MHDPGRKVGTLDSSLMFGMTVKVRHGTGSVPGARWPMLRAAWGIRLRPIPRCTRRAPPDGFLCPAPQPRNNSLSASSGVSAGMGDRSKSLTFLVTMFCAPQVRAAATCSASSKSRMGSSAA